ncbi:hypothetical protein BJ165DRAFT_1011754 [Panaeolus papilionaceus]|nr:hypothetical protein BJ165DRAFT_1011754 [Panaeolus papilionaceus]
MEGVEEGKVNEQQNMEKVEDRPTPYVQPTSPAQSNESVLAVTEPEPDPMPVSAAKKILWLAEFIARKMLPEGDKARARQPPCGWDNADCWAGAILTPTVCPWASLGPVSGPRLGAGTTSAASGVISANLTPTNGPVPTLTPTPHEAATPASTPGLSSVSTPSAPLGAPLLTLGIFRGPGTSLVGGQTVGLGLGLAGGIGGISSGTVSSMSTFSVAGESEEKDRIVVDKDDVVGKDKDDVMNVDEERSVNGRDENGRKESLSPLSTMREMKDGSHPSSTLSKDVKKVLHSPAYHALSPLINVGSLNMHLTNGHASILVYSLSPVPPSALGL